MDTTTAILLAASLLAVVVVGLRAVGAWQHIETERLAQRYAQVANANLANPKKNGGKAKAGRTQQEAHEPDILDDLVERLEPHRDQAVPFLQGLLDAKKVPLNVAKLFDKNPREMDRAAEMLEIWLEQQMKNDGGQGGQPPAGRNGAVVSHAPVY